MIWEHKARMHWVCMDIPGVTVDVLLNKDKWLFTAFNNDTGLILETSKHEHPIEAMKMADKFKEMGCGLKGEETRGESQTSATEASC